MRPRRRAPIRLLLASAFVALALPGQALAADVHRVTFGPSCDGYDGLARALAPGPASRHLVVWARSDRGQEVRARLLGDDGAPVSPEISLSDPEPDGSPLPERILGNAVYLPTIDRYVAVWDDANQDIHMAWIRRDGSLDRSEAVFVAPNYRERRSRPQMAYNPVTDELLVAYERTRSEPNSSSEILAQRYSLTGTELDEPVRVSNTQEGGGAYLYAAGARIAVDTTDGSYLVSFGGTNAATKAEGAAATFVQRLSPAGQPVGVDDREIARHPNSDFVAEMYRPGVAFHRERREYLLAWTSRVDREYELVGRRLDEDGVPVGETRQISDLRRPADDEGSPFALQPLVVHNPVGDQYAVGWVQMESVWNEAPLRIPHTHGVSRYVAPDGLPLGHPVDVLPGGEDWKEAGPAPQLSPAHGAPGFVTVGHRDVEPDPGAQGYCDSDAFATRSDGPSEVPDPEYVPPRDFPQESETPAPGGTSPAPPSDDEPPLAGSPGDQPPVVAPPAPAAPVTFRWPSTRRCLSRRVIRVRVAPRRGERVRSVTVRINGRRQKGARVRRGRVTVDLRKRARGRYRVRITAVLADGTRRSQTRRFRTCAKKERTRRR